MIKVVPILKEAPYCDWVNGHASVNIRVHKWLIVECITHNVVKQEAAYTYIGTDTKWKISTPVCVLFVWACKNINLCFLYIVAMVL
jgi:hypothetical protein